MDWRALPRAARPPAADAVIAACFVVVGLTEVWAQPDVERWLAGPFVALGAGALAWRRRAPLAVAGTTVGVTTLSAVIAAPIDSLIVVIPMAALAIYSLAAHAAPRRAVGGLVACVVAVWIATFSEGGPGVDNLAFGLVVAGGPWLAGWMVRRRTEQAVGLALRARELERSQLEREQAAVAEERARIARELHDIIAHSVSVMTIQAGAVEEVLDRDTEQARAAASSIRQTGRQAQVDLRRLLGVLREEEAGARTLAPQPGLADLDELIDSVRRTGMEVRVTVEGTPRRLPPALDLAAFRVIQEALTNTLKHARATVASVGVRYGTDGVDLEVVDDGVQTVRTGTGNGLVGMRERVSMYGGQLDFGPAPAGGFRIHALLPVDGEAE